MKKIIWSWLCCLSLILTACSTDEEQWGGTTAGKVEITANIVPARDTRISINSDGEGTFTEGDRIRLFVQPDNASRTPYDLFLNNGVWQPQLTWDQLGQGGAEFIGYYPAVQQSYGRFSYQISYDQNKTAEYQRSDLLRARTRVAHGQRVDLNFEHMLSRLTVRISSDTYTEELLSKAIVEVWGFTKADFDLATGEIVKLDYGSLQRRIRMKYVGDGVFQAILLPHEIFEEWKEVNLNPWVSLSIDQTVKTVVAPATLADGTPFNRLEPGKEVTLNINLNKEDPAIWVNQTKFVYGLKNPPLSQWGYAYADDKQKIIGLTWKPEYGWFDCNKKDPVTESENDNNMCWAASAANVIHWWLEQNKENVARYGKFTGPSKYPNSLESEIFQLYKDHFENEGYFPKNAINWFFTGRDGAQHRDGAGFFQDVFGLKTVVRAMSFGEIDPDGKRRFNQGIKQAFRSKEAISCAFTLPNGSSHAINIWGADFDAQGDICALYIVDNNDRGWEDQNEHYEGGEWIIKTGLFRKPIVYKNGVPYMESSAAGFFTMRMNEVVFLGLHEREWKAYFEQHP